MTLIEWPEGRGFENNTKYRQGHKAVVWSYVYYW